MDLITLTEHKGLMLLFDGPFYQLCFRLISTSIIYIYIRLILHNNGMLTTHDYYSCQNNAGMVNALKF